MSSTMSSDYISFGEGQENNNNNNNKIKDDDPEDPTIFHKTAARASALSSGNDKDTATTATNDGISQSTSPSSSSSSSSPTSVTFRQHITLFFAMATPYFRENSEGRCLFVGLICLMLLDSAVRVVFSYLARDFWTALGDKDADEFYRIIRNFCIALLFLAPINVFYRFQQQRLAVRWRQWMTTRIMYLYFYNDRHQIYYKLEQQQQHQAQQQEWGQGQNLDLNSTQGRVPRMFATTPSVYVDNPDQRIAEDVRWFTQYSLSFFLTVTVSIIDLSAFSTVLYLIEPTLFLSIIGFAALGTVVTMLIGQGLVKLNFERLHYEADFRLSLVRIRTNAESIAFFRGEESEGKDVKLKFSNVIKNAFEIVGTQRNLEFFTTTYNYITWILPVVVIAPQYMAGVVELGVIQQAAAAFGHVLEDLSLIINEFEGLTSFTASIGRLHQFLRAIQQADPDRDEPSPLMSISVSDRFESKKVMNDGIFKATTTATKLENPRSAPLKVLETNEDSTHSIRIHEHSPSSSVMSMASLSSAPAAARYALSIHDLRLDTPNRHISRTLISSLNLDLRWGERLLIHGESGIGKSSLLRAIAGLWTSGSGTIERANKVDTYFLPQRPYCPIGTLREQLLYPERLRRKDDDRDVDLDHDQNGGIGIRDQISHSQLLDTLTAVNLGDLPSRLGDGNDIAGLDASADWSNMLSLGEQQRLAFGRILIHKPRLVIVDEATSACDVKTEEILYTLLRNLKSVDTALPTTIVSVGHRPTLLGYHDRRLHIFKDEMGKTSYSLTDVHSTSTNKDGLESQEVAGVSDNITTTGY